MKLLASLEHQPVLADKRERPLLHPKRGALFYPDLGPLGRAPKGGEYGHVDAHLNRVIPPVPGGHHPSVQIEDALDF